MHFVAEREADAKVCDPNSAGEGASRGVFLLESAHVGGCCAMGADPAKEA